MTYSYVLVYLVTEIFLMYIIHKFMLVFYDKPRVSKLTIIISYVLYYIVNTVIYFATDIPIFYVIGTVVSLFLTTFLYDNTMKKNVITTFLLYAVLLSSEFVFVFISETTSSFNLFESYRYNSEIGLILIKFFIMIIVLVLRSFKNFRKVKLIQTKYWVFLIIAPITFVLILFVFVFNNGIQKNMYLLLISIVTIFGFSILMFFCYDFLFSFICERLSSKFVKENKEHYNSTIKNIENNNEHEKLLIKEFEDKLYPIYELALKQKNYEIINCFSGINNFENLRCKSLISGNYIIDNMVSFKFANLSEKNVELNYVIEAPCEIKIYPSDLTLILEVVIDNAIKGTMMLKTNRRIELNIKYSKSILHIYIENSFDFKLIKKVGIESSEYVKFEEYGFGLTIIEKIVKSYAGILEANYNTNTFKIKILLYETL